MPQVTNTGKEFNSGSPLIDEFGRIRISTPYTVLDTKQIFDNLPLFYDDSEVSGSGTSSVYSNNRASSLMSVSENTAGKRVRQTKQRGIYQPGKGQLVFFTFVFSAGVSGVIKRVGYFDDNNGLFLEQNGSSLYFVQRSNVSGSPVNTKISQNDWNINPLNGNKSDKIILDITKGQILFVEFQWLGQGRVSFGFFIDSKLIYCHSILNANVLDSVYMSTPNLPIRYEIENDGSGSGSSLEHICSTVISEGGQEQNSVPVYASRGGAPLTIGNEDNFTAIISVRLKSGYIGTKLLPDSISILVTTVTNYEWALILNPSIGGSDNASWTDIDNSSIEYDISRNASNVITGGFKIDGGYGSSSGVNKSPITESASSFLTIGSNIDSSMDEIMLCIKNVDGNGGTAYGGIKFKQLS